jgi:hypothetical protein
MPRRRFRIRHQRETDFGSYTFDLKVRPSALARIASTWEAISKTHAMKQGRPASTVSHDKVQEIAKETLEHHITRCLEHFEELLRWDHMVLLVPETCIEETHLLTEFCTPEAPKPRSGRQAQSQIEKQLAARQFESDLDRASFQLLEEFEDPVDIEVLAARLHYSNGESLRSAIRGHLDMSWGAYKTKKR